MDDQPVHNIWFVHNINLSTVPTCQGVNLSDEALDPWACSKSNTNILKYIICIYKKNDIFGPSF